MKLSKYYMPTLREVPADAEIPSHQLMLRAGMIRSLSAGIYSYLPLGYRVIRKVEQIVREEMDRSGALEVLMPAMQVADIWKESGRWEEFGPLMVRFKDRNEREYCLGPTHEEVIADIVRDEVRSYKDLPFNLYQIQTKVRDEIRPRFGLMRAKEFIMKDAYTLDIDEEGLDKAYQNMYDAYVRVFERCGLDTRVVEADSGAMGGSGSHEFMVLADSGEDDLAFCTECEYAANVERAEAALEISSPGTDATAAKAATNKAAGDPAEASADTSNNIAADAATSKVEIEKVHTPDATTIEDLVNMIGVSPEKMIKTMAYIADDQPVVALVRGDDQLNEVKFRNHLKAVELRPAHPDEFPERFGSVAGFIGPVDLPENIRIVADRRIQELEKAVTGANEKDYHLVNVNPHRDIAEIEAFTELRTVQAGDPCPRCGGALEIKSGIEVGHIFKLGTKYSSSMGATYLDENGKAQPIVMGSYGIGITRVAAAAVEQHHDDRGIVWPLPLAPFQVIILPLGNSDDVGRAAEELYEDLQDAGLEVLLDDRNERAGVKFNDAELIGIPLRITIGSRSLENDEFEVQIRRSGKEFNIDRSSACSEIENLLEEIE